MVGTATYGGTSIAWSVAPMTCLNLLGEVNIIGWELLHPICYALLLLLVFCADIGTSVLSVDATNIPTYLFLLDPC